MDNLDDVLQQIADALQDNKPVDRDQLVVLWCAVGDQLIDEWISSWIGVTDDIQDQIDKCIDRWALVLRRPIVYIQQHLDDEVTNYLVAIQYMSLPVLEQLDRLFGLTGG